MAAYQDPAWHSFGDVIQADKVGIVSHISLIKSKAVSILTIKVAVMKRAHGLRFLMFLLQATELMRRA